MRARVVVVGMLSLLVTLAGCSKVNKDGGGTKPSLSPTPPALAVEVALISAVLADDCKTAQADSDKGASAKTMRRVDSQDDAKMAPDRDTDRLVPPPCKQSTVQLHLVGGAGDTPAHIELGAIKLFDAKGEKHIQDLVARNPQVWSEADGHYLPWDGTVAPKQDLKVSFDLSAPNWVAIGNGDAYATQGMGFKLTVVVRTGGKDSTVDVVVKSPWVAREPEVDT